MRAIKVRLFLQEPVAVCTIIQLDLLLVLFADRLALFLPEFLIEGIENETPLNELLPSLRAIVSGPVVEGGFSEASFIVIGLEVWFDGVRKLSTPFQAEAIITF